LKRILMLSILLLPMVFLASNPAQAQIEDKLVLVSPISRASIDPVAKAFVGYVKDKHGLTVTVEHIPGGSPELYAKVKAWAGKPDGDVFWGGEYSYYPELTSAGLLEPHLGASWDQIPADFQGFALKDAKGHWMSVSFYCPGIMTNRDLLAKLKLPEPKTWDDLLDPKYKGQIIMTTPARSGGLHIDVEILLQSRGEEKGWTYWRRLAVNVGKWAARSLEVSSLVEKGEYAIGIAIAETSAVMSKKAGYNVGFVYPDVAFFSPSPIGILKGTPRPNIAKLWMDWVPSKEAQAAFLLGDLIPAKKDLKLSDYPDIPSAAILKEFMKAENVYGITTKNFPMNFDLYTKRFSDVNNLYDDTISKKLEELTKAWNAIQDAVKTLTEAESTITAREKEGYDVAKAKDSINTAKTSLTQATTNFDTGKYAEAATAAVKSKDQAAASVGLTRKLEWYEQPLNLAVVFLVVVIAAVALVTLKKRKK